MNDLQCLHCGKTFRPDDVEPEFCCAGCRFVYGLIHHEKLEKFYQLKSKTILPVRADLHAATSSTWLEQLAGVQAGRLLLSIEGIQCAACVWLIHRLAERAGIRRASIDSVAGTIELHFAPASVDLPAFFLQVQRFGYRLGPPRQNTTKSHHLPLLLRVGVLAAIAMNSMTLSLAFYLGLDPSQSLLFRFFNELNLLLTMVGVVFGGSYFFRRAWEGVKIGVVHFDTTVSVGILVGLVASSYTLFTGAAEHTYFDSLNGFIFLMLLGRFIQTRTLEKHQATVLGHLPLAHQRLYRQQPHPMIADRKQIDSIAFSQINCGDELIIASGDIIPVECTLLTPHSIELNLQWINGESLPKTYAAGDLVPAGGRLISLAATTVLARESFSASSLSQLEGAVALHDPLPQVWAAVTRWYVPTILGFSALGFALWAASDLAKAVQVAVAVTVVTCPCALGIAVPLARTMANRLLTQEGIFARTTFLFERLQGLRKVVFDKTGTLTLADLRLAEPQNLQKLSAQQRAVLLAAVSRSRHPASRALYVELASPQAEAVVVEVDEEPGVGLHIRHAGKSYFLGRAREDSAMATNGTGKYRAQFEAAGRVVMHFEFIEQPLAGLQETMVWLQKQGLQIYLCSGDQWPRVREFAASLHLAAQHIIGQASPQEKAAFVRKINTQDTMYIGDGINDALALREAEFRGVVTQATTHVLDNSGDFLVYAADARWLRRLLVVSRAFRRTLRANLIFVFVYNVLTISAALSGWISPLIAAILMPASSLFIVGLSLGMMQKPDLDHG